VDPIDLWKDYATIPETAVALEMCERSVRCKINAPNGWPHCRIGGKVRLHIPTLRKIIEASTVSRNPSRRSAK
jgi:hypothetical protein